MDELALSLTTSEGTKDITMLCASISLSGDYRQCCRTLALEVVVSPDDKTLPVVYFALGGVVQLRVGQALAFYGHVVMKSKATGAATMTVTCMDRGLYLKRNEATYNFINASPEQIVQTVCRDYGIGLYAAQRTGITISRKFRGVSLYQIIDTAYTLAGEKTGKRYMIRFVGPDIGVFEKQQTVAQRTLKSGQHIITSSYSEDISNMVNRVVVRDTADKVITTVSDDDAVALYGLMKKELRQITGQDAKAQAEKTLADNGVERKCTVNVLGDIGLVTGETVYVQEPFTGLCGVFWIDADTHLWQKGIWTTKLTLNYQNIMREGTFGQEG